MNITEVHVDVQALISDGNYGNERWTVSYTASVDEGEDMDDVTIALAQRARAHVYAQVKRSPRSSIRQALETPEESERRYAFENAEAEPSSASPPSPPSPPSPAQEEAPHDHLPQLRGAHSVGHQPPDGQAGAHQPGHRREPLP